MHNNAEKPGNSGLFRQFLRKVWDSNPGDVVVKAIRNQPRYDHFDNPPYLVNRIREKTLLLKTVSKL